MDVIEKLRSVVLNVLALDYAGAPRIDRMALYRARVDACASDGSTVDVTPASPRVAKSVGKGVRVRVGIPGAAAVVSPGAEVLIGWEAGDPSRPYAVPSWESGATVTKLVLAASMVYGGAESGAQFVALANLVGNQLTALKSAINGWTPVPNDGGAALKTALSTLFATWPGSVAASQFKAK